MLHAAIVILFALAGRLLHVPYPALLCACFFVGREHCQAEYRWIAAYGCGKRANMPWYGGFDLRVWNCKSLMDWGLPIGVALIAEVIFV